MNGKDIQFGSHIMKMNEASIIVKKYFINNVRSVVNELK